MRHLIAMSLLLLSTRAWTCSCFGIASIDETIASRPILVEAQVVSREEVNSREYGTQVHSVTLRVTRSLKGLVSSDTIIVEQRMCYASLHPELMELGHTYVLPLPLVDEGRYALAGCAHSGMELIEGKLYTFEQASGVQRKLRFYQKYADFQRRFHK
jgi:hypothetical protein